MLLVPCMVAQCTVVIRRQQCSESSRSTNCKDASSGGGHPLHYKHLMGVQCLGQFCRRSAQLWHCCSVNALHRAMG